MPDAPEYRCEIEPIPEIQLHATEYEVVLPAGTMFIEIFSDPPIEQSYLERLYDDQCTKIYNKLPANWSHDRRNAFLKKLRLLK